MLLLLMLLLLVTMMVTGLLRGVGAAVQRTSAPSAVRLNDVTITPTLIAVVVVVFQYRCRTCKHGTVAVLGIFLRGWGKISGSGGRPQWGSAAGVLGAQPLEADDFMIITYKILTTR